MEHLEACDSFDSMVNELRANSDVMTPKYSKDSATIVPIKFAKSNSLVDGTVHIYEVQ